MLENLIGAQIVSIKESIIELKLNDKTHYLKIEVDQGDCCGYADFETNLIYLPNDLRNPIITDVKFVQKDDDSECSSSIVTFYGESKEIATIESEAGSGSGWVYGACVNLICETLDVSEVLASW